MSPLAGATPPEQPARPRGVLADGACLALGTLSAIPVPPPTRVDRPVAGWAMTLAPVAGLPLAAAWVAAAALGRWTGVPGLVVGGVTVALVVLLTRAMHLDGVADYADGLSASYDRERALAVMKTGDVGPSGAGAIALCVLLQAASLGGLAATWHGAALGAAALVVSRQLLAWGCLPRVPSARPGGLGDMMAGTVGASRASASLLVTLLPLVALAGWTGAWWHPLVVAAAGMLAAWAVVGHACRRLGGITGDVLGATIEIGLTVTLVVASALV